MTKTFQFDDFWLQQRLPYFHQSARIRADCLAHAVRAVNPEMVGYLLGIGAEPNGLPIASIIAYEADAETAQESPLGLTLRLMDMLVQQGDKHLELLKRHAQTIALLAIYGADLDRLHIAHSQYASARDHLRDQYPLLASAIETELERIALDAHLDDLKGHPPIPQLRI